MALRSAQWNRPALIIALVIIALSLIYRPTLQTIINGSSDLMMIDVGETQAVLNTWGTLHPTGYPLYVILGNLMVAILKLLGVSAATAPGLVSWLWGTIALILVFSLATRLIHKPILAVVITVLLGLTRFVWVHQVVAEVYSFTFLLQILVLWLAIWPHPIRHRVLWLAFVGGIGVFHHRTVILLALGLVYAAWPDLKPVLRKPRVLIVGLLLGLIGFLPYLYLPLRASTNAAWVYGKPDTWSEFWRQFNATEAGHFLGWPASTTAFLDNWEKINRLLLHELSLPAILLGVIGLGIGLRNPEHRRPAIALILAMALNYCFAVTLYTDILASIIIAINLCLAFGWLFLMDAALSVHIGTGSRQVIWAYNLSIGLQFALYGTLIAVPIYYSRWLYDENERFIHRITHDRTGLDTIALAEHAPPDSTLMLAWGPRYFAIGFAQDVEQQLTHIRRADHKTDFPALLEQGPLITPEYTLFNQPVAWWEARLGSSVYLTAAAPYLVRINTVPHLAETSVALPADFDAPVPVVPLDAQIACTAEYIVLTVDWASPETPARNLSIFVHLMDSNGDVIAQADQSNPVYGWRPMTGWLPNEIITDVYPLPNRADGIAVLFGLYERLPSGEFENYNVQTLPVDCNKKAPGDNSEGLKQ